jgi:hypothetical protein
MSHPFGQNDGLMYALFFAAWHNGLAGEPHPFDAIVLAKLIKLALLAGFMGLLWREVREFL